MFKQAIFLAATAVLLTGCITDDIAVTPINPPATVAPSPAPMNMRDVTWQVLTLDDLKRIVKELEANPDPNYVIYALDNGNFQALNLNLVETRRFILEQQAVITFYKKLDAVDSPTPATATPVKPKKRKLFGIPLD